ncbi:hypothetical protein [Desulfosporosinus sp. OT]|uniref:DUF6930 domain-containing protein n=1 Tax=Desulfosporosinus sp. OT TaxID=913865 RepID=UPI000223A443|nr:hypothetical protein [Desulfosporosinus sp. OT]EGW39237.1 hypothetical protein DOT_2856 [Desulfosporosinus sp. OT]
MCCRNSKEILDHEAPFTFLIRVCRKSGEWVDQYITAEPDEPEFVSFHIQDRPYFPKVGVLLDHHSGLVVSFEMMKDIQEEGYKCIDRFVDYVEQNMPTKLLVARVETYYLYLDVCKQRGLPIEMVEQLEYAKGFRNGVFDQFVD